MEGKVKLLIFIMLLHSPFIGEQVMAAPVEAYEISGIVVDRSKEKRLPYAYVLVLQKGNVVAGTACDENGGFSFSGLAKGEYLLKASYVGYKTSEEPLFLSNDRTVRLAVIPEIYSVDEVVVTAVEKQTVTSTSLIDRKAMDHLQPSSFTDLLSLLPGGRTSTPDMGSANTIRLREVGISSSDYATSSLGVKFMVDGAAIGTDANMQALDISFQGDEDSYRNHVSAGVDMRTISTDNIESVEIVRGIPSVKYGDLTSGLVKINRKNSRTPFEARFKADQFGKLFSAGKGFDVEKRNLAMNVDGGFLLSRSDPRNPLETYNRINFSCRMKKEWERNDEQKFQWRLNADYSGSLDHVKNDPEVLKHKEDSYKSSYHRIGLYNVFSFIENGDRVLRKLSLSSSLALSLDRIEKTKLVFQSRDAIAPSYDEEGEFDGVFLPIRYKAEHMVDGKPFYSTTSLDAEFGFTTGRVRHGIIAGLEWQYNRNFGRGQVYDPMRPIFITTAHRPRSYKDIPATSILSFYVEDMLDFEYGRHKFSVMAGIRSSLLMGVGKEYAMHARPTLDPRLNVQWNLPSLGGVYFSLTAGVGSMSKMPTMEVLYPDRLYTDLVQLNYWHPNQKFRRVNMRTYIIDRKNVDIEPARNLKWELRAGVRYRRHKLYITYFNEEMDDGFRSTSKVIPLEYKKYDKSGIDASQLDGPPSLDGLPYVEDKVLTMYGIQENGSRINKEGVEFQYFSPRIKAIATRLTVNGAWFHTVYENSRPEFHTVRDVIGGIPVSDKYIGLYDWKDSYIRREFTSNFILDTYIEKLGITFSATAECYWYGKYESPAVKGKPVAYMDTDGVLKAYTKEDETHLFKQKLNLTNIRTNDWDDRYRFYMCTNFKVSKEFSRYAVLSFFADRILNYAPDYKKNGFVIRRSFTPYFGMELNIRI